MLFCAPLRWSSSPTAPDRSRLGFLESEKTKRAASPGRGRFFFSDPRKRSKNFSDSRKRRGGDREAPLRFLGSEKTEEGPVRRSWTAAPPQRSAEKHAKLALTAQRNSLRPLPTKKNGGSRCFRCCGGMSHGACPPNRESSNCHTHA